MKSIAKRILKNCILAVYRAMSFVLPVNHRKIVFMSNLGRSYGGNPKSIYEEMVQLGLDHKYRCYFLLENPKVNLPGTARTIKLSRFRYYYELAVAGYIVSDTRLPNYIRKRKGTKYLQTWHGTPLKKLALDMTSYHMAGGQTVEEYREEFKKNSSTWDYLISQNKFSSNIFRHAFAFDGNMLEIGYPRNDVLFTRNHKTDLMELKKKYQLPLDKKIILYAPTWRDNSFYDKASYKMNAPLDYDLLFEKLSKDYVILIKYHYMVREKLDFSSYHGFYRVMNSSVDISELYLISDLLITDYSSVMFDYSILKRPILFYVYDLEEYKDELRGFYFDFIKQAPGPFVMTTEQLVDEIRDYDWLKYKEKYEEFCNTYHTFEKGNASKCAIKALLDENI